MKKISGAEAVIKSLIFEGVEHIFGYPGGAIMPIYDALFHYEKEIKHILVRHEQCAAHAAQGYSRVSRKLGVVFATSGPGATNLVTGITDAIIDSSPMLCITGQVSSNLLGTNAFQETDVIGITKPITKWNCQVVKASEIPGAIAKGIYIAKSGRPGPVLIDITKDAQFELFDYHYEKCKKINTYFPIPDIDYSKIQEAADLINIAKRPLILFGQGVLLSNASNELKEFVEKTGIPAAWTLLGLSALPTDHNLNVGMLGMHGNYGPNILTNKSDVIIAIGMRFDDRVTGKVDTYAKNSKIIHIDIDFSEIDKIIKTDIAIIADAKEALQILIEKVNKNNHGEWVNDFKIKNKLEFEKVIIHETEPNEGGIKMGEIVKNINKLTNGDAIIVTDVGQHQMIASRYAKFNHPFSNVTSGGLGTMGFGLPAAIGAKIAQPDREVILIAGDGGIQMTINELSTIFQEKLNIKIAIFNNNFLGMVRQWQQLFFDNRYSSVEMVNPDFVTIAKGFYINSSKVDKREHLLENLEKMLKEDKPYLLEIVCEKEENVFPMIPTGASIEQIRLE